MVEILYKSVGTLHYDRTRNGGYKLVLMVDQEISNYYRALIPKWIYTQPQMYPAHVSVVRKEVPINLDAWGKYEGHKVEFFYSPIIHSGKVYYWLNVFCKRLEEIRIELGLPVSSPYTLPPEGFVKAFHTTIGNTKCSQISK